MTRGTLFYYEDDNNIWSSTEFNGDMYHGTPEKPEGRGDDVIKLMANLESLDDFKDVLVKINRHYQYDEGNDCYSVSDAAIEQVIKASIEWVDKERPDLKGDDHFDPRAWKSRPTFKNTNTWKYWGMPNLSDYSYIYNNSGSELTIITKGVGKTMTIPDGGLGVLNYGANDCICMDGKIIDGMGNYEESDYETESKVEKRMLSRHEFYEYVLENYNLDGTSRALVKNIINSAKTLTELSELLDGIGLDDEIWRVKL